MGFRRLLHSNAVHTPSLRQSNPQTSFKPIVPAFAVALLPDVEPDQKTQEAGYSYFIKLEPVSPVGYGATAHLGEVTKT